MAYELLKMYTPWFVVDCDVQFANIFEVSILPGFHQLLLLFQMLQRMHGVCHRWDQDDTTALIYQSCNQNLSGSHVLHSSRMG